MELLEKITLYDILGYTLPGGIALYILCGYTIETDLTTFGIVIYIAMSFLLGILISEASAIVTERVKKSKKIRNKIWDSIGLEEKIVGKALEKANVLEKNIKFDKEKLWEYYTYIYSDIQVDKTYNRIHNYASAALLYKNMVLVSAIAVFMYGKEGILELKVGGAIGAMILFAIRWYRFEKKKQCYAISWYVEKYIK